MAFILSCEFGSLMCLCNLNLISNFNLSKVLSMQSKQHRKPHKTVDVRDLTPLELVRSDLFKMNIALTKGG